MGDTARIQHIRSGLTHLHHPYIKGETMGPTSQAQAGGQAGLIKGRDTWRIHSGTSDTGLSRSRPTAIAPCCMCLYTAQQYRVKQSRSFLSTQLVCQPAARPCVFHCDWRSHHISCRLAFINTPCQLASMSTHVHFTHAGARGSVLQPILPRWCHCHAPHVG